MLKKLFGRKNRRDDPRFPCDHSAVVVDLTGGHNEVSAKIVNYSRSGLGVEVKEFLMRGTTVEVRWAGNALRARVEYCRESGNGAYHMGLRAEGLEALQAGN